MRPYSHLSPVLCFCLALFLSSCGVANAPVPREELRPAKIEFRVADTQEVPGAQPVQFEGQTLYLDPEVVISNSDIASVSPYSQSGKFLVSLKFKEEGARRLNEVTQKNLGKRMAVLLDGKVLMAPVIQSAIGDSAMLEGDFDGMEVAARLESALGKR
jgi:preprotein translocase subunit SecD